MPLNEADTCRVYVTPKLQEAGWETHPHSLTEQKTFTDGRIKIVDGRPIRGDKKRADYLLRYTRDFPLAVVESKPEGATEGTGLQQSKNYAEILGLKFAYATDGHWIVEFDYITGTERSLSQFPTPQELFDRLKKAESLSDVATCKNIVLVRVVNAMTEFKQIIGRGTRLREEYGKTWFNIIDYTGSATARFADPDFDGYPEEIDVTEIDDQGNEEGTEILDPTEETGMLPDDNSDYDNGSSGEEEDEGNDGGVAEPRKFYVDDGRVDIIGHVVYELDENGNQLRVIQYTDYTAEHVRTLFRTADELRDEWADPFKRDEVLARLEGIGIDFLHLAQATENPDADPLDLLCHLAFQRPLRTRKERAEHLRKGNPDFFDRYNHKAQKILAALLDKYAEHGPDEFKIPRALQNSPIVEHGNPMEIADLFGGPLEMRQAVDRLQQLLYSE